LTAAQVRAIQLDKRKRTWVAMETGLTVYVINNIKQLPLPAAIEKYCQ
jgi:hypothetical protein